MAVASRETYAYSTSHSLSCPMEMSRIQQDLAASRYSQNELATQNGMASNTLRRALCKGRKPHVCIVGAGFAGLRCADILLQRGVKVTIYEARDRVGGRVCYCPFSYPTDLLMVPLSSSNQKSEITSLTCMCNMKVNDSADLFAQGVPTGFMARKTTQSLTLSEKQER